MERLMAEMLETMAETEIEWLRSLEEKVHAAAGRIRELREEKGTLEGRIQDLEQQLAARPGGLTEQLAFLRDENTGLRQRIQELEGHLAAAPSPEDAARWNEEREEIRDRVGRLVEHLEGLL
jgi:predicted  nucleic acid-binding Zn-ribbon protein